MPFTPYHFGLSATIALLFKKYMDIPVFVLVNVVVDIEPLLVMLFGFRYPLHGYCHTFLFGSLLGLIWAVIAYVGKNILKGLMNLLRLEYNPRFRNMVVSAILGVWLHVLLDAPLYLDIRPFYPFKANPFYGILTITAVYSICRLSFIPAMVLYIFIRKSKVRDD